MDDFNDVGDAESLTRYAWLAIAAALTTMGMKALAAVLTGSVGLLSDALESGVNLVAAGVALAVLKAIGKAPDDEFTYGRAKAEYLSAGVEGTMIVLAAIAIAVVAVDRLIHPADVQKIGIGLVVSLAAGLVNLVVATIMLRAGRQHDSITLEADGKHLMTDVWTSVGVLVGVILVGITGWRVLDPLVAIAVAVNIVVSGFRLVRRSVRGLLDASLPGPQRLALEAVLERHRAMDVEFHAVRTRQAGRRSFASFHVLVPGDRTVASAHHLVEAIEDELRAAIPRLTVNAHIEPLEDPRSYADEGLDRKQVPKGAVPPEHGWA